MATKIDQDRIDRGDLTQEEIRYLQLRGKLPAHIKPILRGPNGEWLDGTDSDVPNIDYYLDQLPLETLQEAINRREKTLDDNTEANSGTIEDKGGIVDKYDDEDEDEEDTEGEVTYEEMTTKQLRAALADRGLIVDGKKDDYIARLRRSDAGQEEPEDILTI